MQTDSYPIKIIGLGGFGESGIYYFGEGLRLSGQCLVFYLSLINCTFVPKIAANDRLLVSVRKENALLFQPKTKLVYSNELS